MLGRRHQEHGFYFRRHLPVQLRHGELVVEVRDGAQTLEDDGGVPLAGEVDHQLVEVVDDDVGMVGKRVAQELEALFDGEQCLLAQRLLR